MKAEAVYYVGIVFKTPLDRLFTYKTSLGNLLFRRVVCSFGSRRLVGVVLSQSLSPPPDLPQMGIKEVEEIVDDEAFFTEGDLEVAKRIQAYYFSSLGEALSLFVPFSTLKPKPMGQGKNQKKNLLTPPSPLSERQASVFQQIIQNERRFFLLRGVTGSGKTHVYAQLIQHYALQGKQAILLLPEIVLTPQTQRSFLSFFDPDRLGILHSKVGAQKKINIQKAFRRGDIQVLIGTRSALFLMNERVGILIVDEEHEGTYKNSTTPRYHVRQVAQMMAKEYPTKVLYASATPSIESYFQANRQKMELLEIEERYHEAPLPESRLIEDAAMEGMLISDLIVERLKELKRENKKALVYINRRGYARAVRCLECAETAMCSKCDVPYVYHKGIRRLVCHYCNESLPYEGRCPSCSSRHVEEMGSGIERIEGELQQRVEGLRIGRLDSDKAGTPLKIDRLLKSFREGEMDVLIGTQILSKGHDFSDVDDVFVLFPENMLGLADFRSAERTYSQITQVSGRAGRRDKRGHIMIQSQMPHHYAIALGARQDYKGFYQEENERRQCFDYPPHSRLFRFVIRGRDRERVEKSARNIHQYFHSMKMEDVEILGPAPCILSKIKYNYRWHVLFKIKKNIALFMERVRAFKEGAPYAKYKIYVEFDMDPQDIL